MWDVISNDKATITSWKLIHLVLLVKNLLLHSYSLQCLDHFGVLLFHPFILLKKGVPVFLEKFLLLLDFFKLILGTLSFRTRFNVKRSPAVLH